MDSDNPFGIFKLFSKEGDYVGIIPINITFSDINNFQNGR
jgi:hypothetical protein